LAGASCGWTIPVSLAVRIRVTDAVAPVTVNAGRQDQPWPAWPGAGLSAPMTFAGAGRFMTASPAGLTWRT
jgi:hypothetical protein